MVANAAAANGGRSSPSQGPATPSTSTVSTALTSINSSWIVRFVAKRDARTPTAITANTTPAPISTNSSCTAYGGQCASQRRNPTAAMSAAAAIPLMVGSCHASRAGVPAALPGVRLKEMPAELPAGGVPSADTYLQAGPERTATLTTSNDNVRDAILLRQRNKSLNSRRRRLPPPFPFSPPAAGGPHA